MKFKMISVISLITSLEAFLNQIIKNNFNYKQIKRGKSLILNKKKIESSQVSFKEKLTGVIAQLLNQPDFSIKNAEIIESIMELYHLRREIIHLKTNALDEMGLYFKSIGRLLDIDLGKLIVSIKEYINIVEPNFIE